MNDLIPRGEDRWVAKIEDARARPRVLADYEAGLQYGTGRIHGWLRAGRAARLRKDSACSLTTAFCLAWAAKSTLEIENRLPAKTSNNRIERFTEVYYLSVVCGGVSRDRAFLSLCNVALGEPSGVAKGRIASCRIFGSRAQPFPMISISYLSIVESRRDPTCRFLRTKSSSSSATI